MYYKVDSIDCSLILINYKNSEKRDLMKVWHMPNEEIGSTIIDVINKVAKTHHLDAKNATYRDSIVSISGLTDEHGAGLDDEEIERWKDGNALAYKFTISFDIAACEYVTHTDLNNAGIAPELIQF